MPTVSRTFEVQPPPEIVIPYLADFGHAEQWDPGTERCERLDDGPVKVGSTWHNTSKIVGITTDLTYTLEQLTAERVVLVGRNKTATSTETIEVARAGTGSSITYTNDVEFRGAAQVAAPLAKVIFEKLAHDTEQQLTQTINALAR